MVRVCKNCGVAGHNVRTCTQPMKPQAPPSPPKKRGRPKGSKNKPKTVTTTVITDPQVVAQPPSSPPVSSKTIINGIDVSGMKKKDVRGMTQYETKKGTFILFPEINITREDTFMNVVRRIKEVVKQRNSSEGMKLVFKVKELKREEERLPAALVRYAKKDVVPGSYPKKVNGVNEWFWQTITYMVEHSEFEDSKFEYIGQIVMDVQDETKNGDWTSAAYYFDRTTIKLDGVEVTPPQALGGSKAWQEYEPIGKEMEKALEPQIKRWQEIFKEHSLQQARKKFPDGQEAEALSRGLSSVKKIYGGSCYCFKCNPKGDEMWRGSANLYLTTQDIKNYRIGRLGKQEDAVSYIDIPKGTLIPMGGGCEYSVNPIDIELVTSLYGDSRIKSTKQNQWQNPYGMYGWGFKDMDVRAYLTRVFSYYNKKFDTTIKMLKRMNKKIFLIPDELVLTGGITYESLNPYQLDKYIESELGGIRHSDSVRDSYNKIKKELSKKVFPVPVNRGKYNERLPEPKGIFDNKSTFLLEARYYEHNGVYWLQPKNSKDGGIEQFMEAYELQKDDEDFFIEVIQPIYNDDGVLIVDEKGQIEEDFVKLPNPDKLTELYALSGGIKEVYSPDKVKDDVENAIEFLESLKPGNFPPIVDKYFKSQQILNPLALITQVETVSDRKKTHLMASSIWKIYKITKLEDMRKKAYETYLQTKLEQQERISGLQLSFDFLDEKELQIYNNIQSQYTLQQSYIKDNLTLDEYETLRTVKSMTKNVFKRDGMEYEGIYYSNPVDWDFVASINKKVEDLGDAHQKERQRIRELDDKRSIIDRKIRRGFVNAGGYINSYKPISTYMFNIPTAGETYTNEEVFSVLGISMPPYTVAEIVEINNETPTKTANFDSSGLITKLLLTSYQMNILKDYFNKKQMANLGMGQAPKIPTVSTPTPTTSTPTYDRQIGTSQREQLERNIKKTKFPEDMGEDVKGYIYSVSPKTYNNPFPKDTKYVGVITANNDDPNLDGHFLNFPYKGSEVPVGRYSNSPEGMAVIMDFKTLQLDTGWYRTQTKVSKVSMRQD